MDFLALLFDTSDFPARWHCGQWTAIHGYTHIISDLLIFAAYIAIPIVLIWFTRQRRDLPRPFPFVFWLFGAFITACGFTHLNEAIIFYEPIYRFAGLLKALTAVVSWATVLFLIPAIPRALSFKSPEALEREVAAATAELKQSNEELEQFAYVASHDLQEPLRMVVSYMGLLEQRCADQLDEKGKKYVGFASDGAARMKQMVDDLLSYSRIDQGGTFEPVKLDAVVRDVLDGLSLLIRESDATITHEGLPEVVADEAQMRQLMQNLLSNSLKFRGEDAPVIDITTRRVDGFVEVIVRDNGIGFDPEHAERIFQMFQRLHGRADYEGNGIGLALTKRIVERHGGTISAESEPGKGATFRFTLPVEKAAT